MTVIHGQRFVVLILLLKLVLVHATHRNLKTDNATLHEECGVSNTDLSFRIVGGVESPLYAWPWMVALINTTDQNVVNGNDLICGGALITHTHVLTAGHCVYFIPAENLALRLGEHDICSDLEGASPVDFGASSIDIHEKFSMSSGKFDIAIIRMNGYVEFSDSIRPVCLPTRDMSTKTFEHMMTYIAGWGSTVFRGPIFTKLRHVQLKVISNDKCKIDFVGHSDIITNQLCAYSSGGKDACEGDSGGPLVIPINKRFFIIGVVSVGIKCADERYPGIFTRVTSFIDWINYTIQNI